MLKRFIIRKFFRKEIPGPKIENVFYYPENDNKRGFKTFREIGTNIWYHEEDLLVWFSPKEIKKIKKQ